MKENSTFGSAIKRLENEQNDLRSKILEVEKSRIEKEKINILMIFNMLKDIRNHSARILKVEQAVKGVSFFTSIILSSKFINLIILRWKKV